MNIKVTITAILNDSIWGFSDLLDGRSLTETTMAEIKELIEEDTTDVLSGKWLIEESK